MYLISRLTCFFTDQTVTASSLMKGIDFVGRGALEEVRNAVRDTSRIPWFEGKTWNWCVRVDYDRVPIPCPGVEHINAFQWVTAFVAALYLVRQCSVLLGPSVVFRGKGDPVGCYAVEPAYFVVKPPPARFQEHEVVKAGKLYRTICTMLQSGDFRRLILAHRFFELARRQAAWDVRCLLAWVSAETLLGGYGASARSGVSLRAEKLLQAGGLTVPGAKDKLTALYRLRCRVAHRGGWPHDQKKDAEAQKALAAGEETVRQCLGTVIAHGRWRNYRSEAELEPFLRGLETTCERGKADEESNEASAEGGRDG